MQAVNWILNRPEFVRLSWVLFHFIWQGAVCAAALSATLFVLPSRSANARYLAACAIMLIGAAGVPTTWLVLSQHASVRENATALSHDVSSPIPASPVVHSPLVAAEGRARNVSPMVAAPAFAAARSAVGDSRPDLAPADAGPTWQQRIAAFLPWLTAVWFAGVLVLSLRLAFGWSAVGRLRSAASPPFAEPLLAILSRLCRKFEIGWPVRLVETALVEVPTVVGWVRPVVLWPPAAIAGLSVEQFTSLLAHELAHIRRHDYLINLFQTAIETLLFYHPAIWWISSRIRQERECCCDDLAIAACGERLLYARALATLEDLRSRRNQFALAADGGQLLARIRRIVVRQDAAHANGRHWLLGIALSATVAGALAIACYSAFAAATDTVCKALDVTNAKSFALSGVVQSSKGALRNATVLIVSATPRSGTAVVEPACHPDCLRSARTDGEGRFSIRAVDGSMLYRLLVSKDGFETQFVDRVDPLKPEQRVTLSRTRISQGHPDLVCRIVDKNGKPIANAEIIPRRYGFGKELGVEPINKVANVQLTNDSGEAAFHTLKQVDFLNVAVQAHRFAPAVFLNLKCHTGATAVLRLQRGVTVRGQLLINRRPLASVVMGACWPLMMAADEYLGPWEAKTGADGKFEIQNVPPEKQVNLYAKLVSLPGGSAVPVSHQTAGADGTTLDVGKILAKPGHKLSGRVFRADGNPVEPGSYVMVAPADVMDRKEAKLDPNGEFEIDDLPSGLFNFWVMPPHGKGLFLQPTRRNHSFDGTTCLGLVGRIDRDTVLTVEVVPVKSVTLDAFVGVPAAQIVKIVNGLHTHALEGIPPAPAAPQPQSNPAKPSAHSATRPGSAQTNVTSQPSYVIEPPDTLSIDTSPLVPTSTYKIEPLDDLAISVIHPAGQRSSPLANGYLVIGAYSVEPSGSIDLGSSYGRLHVVGLTLGEARHAIARKLRIDSDDQLSIKLVAASSQRQIRGQHLVGPDGTINLGTCGEVYVAGMTVERAQTAAQKHLEKYFEKPEVSVDVYEYASRKYYIIEEGSAVGDAVIVFNLKPGNETVLDAVAQVDGLRKNTFKHIWVDRPAPAGSFQRLNVDWDGITKRGETKTNYLLLSGDRVMVDVNKSSLPAHSSTKH